jgi:hypothetical protein
VLLNNIAWLLRRFPAFAVGGTSRYHIRPVHVDDLARLCLAVGASRATTVTEAVGPDRPTFTELVHAIKDTVGSNSAIVHIPGALMPAVSTALGAVLRDCLLTPDEHYALADGLADTDGPDTGGISLMTWVAQNGRHLGRRYANELDRHFRRPGSRPRWLRGVPPSNNTRSGHDSHADLVRTGIRTLVALDAHRRDDWLACPASRDGRHACPNGSPGRGWMGGHQHQRWRCHPSRRPADRQTGSPLGRSATRVPGPTDHGLLTLITQAQSETQAAVVPAGDPLQANREPIPGSDRDTPGEGVAGLRRGPGHQTHPKK